MFHVFRLLLVILDSSDSDTEFQFRVTYRLRPAEHITIVFFIHVRYALPGCLIDHWPFCGGVMSSPQVVLGCLVVDRRSLSLFLLESHEQFESLYFCLLHFRRWPPIHGGLQTWICLVRIAINSQKAARGASSHGSSNRCPTIICCWIKQFIPANLSMINL